jgi:hypothetical protein
MSTRTLTALVAAVASTLIGLAAICSVPTPVGTADAVGDPATACRPASQERGRSGFPPRCGGETRSPTRRPDNGRS